MALGAFALGAFCGALQASARDFTAGPDTYRQVVERLGPGDRLLLAPGQYRDGLDVHRLAGRPGAPILIEGAPGGASVFLARGRRNTVSLLDSVHVVVRGLTLHGRGLPVDAVKAEGHARGVHYLTLENLTIIGHGHSQQTVGISTKCPARGWVVRGNRILGAGTGMYFGDSGGLAPFVGGLIENNVVLDPIGYALQIKHQVERARDPRARLLLPPECRRPHAPAGCADPPPEQTVIRGNRFFKSANGRLVTSRPNVLIGDVPPSGPGSRDRYLLYGNLFYDNDQPDEPLFQGEGNLALYNNLFVNPRGSGVRIFPHKGRVRSVAVLRNTIVASGMGVSLRGGAPGYRQWLEQNLVFAAEPVFSDVEGDNRLHAVEDAAALLAAPHAGREKLDLAVRAAGTVAGAPRLPAGLEALPGLDRDFLGRERGEAVYGACLPATTQPPLPCR